MNEATYNALQKSIEHWERNAAVKTLHRVSTSRYDCALCDRFFADNCAGCPVAVATKLLGCEQTPYTAAALALHEGNFDAFHTAAQAELDFLRALVPAGGPAQ